jgi:putative tricarboxylic transport membrane protein
MELFIASLTNAAIMATDPYLLVAILGGVAWGCIAGALPGINSVIAIGVMVPFTIGMGPTFAVAFLIAINVGVAFGNSIPAILVGVPGTPSAVMTAIEGYALHRQGKSGLALGVTYYSSVAGQLIATLLFLAMVVPLAQLTYVFLAPELFALYLIGATALVSLTGNNIIKGMAAVAFGLTIAMVGRDPLSAVSRFTFGLPEMRAGLETIPVVLGLIAVSEIFRSMRQTFKWEGLTESFSAKFPPFSALRRVTPFVMLGSVIGSFIGVIPGLAGSAAAIMSYQQSKIWSKHPEEYGRGSIEGIASNESAQNADQAGELVPTFGLGIAGSGSMVVLLGALLMHGFIPGPLLLTEAPELLYAAVAGLLCATAMLGLIGWWVARSLLVVVTFDRALILVGALSLATLGVFSVNGAVFDVLVMLVCGVIGYFMQRYGYPPAGAAIAMILGGGLETNLRAGLMLKGGDVVAFVVRPWTAVFLAVALFLFLYGVYSTVQLVRRERRARAQALERQPGADPRAGIA